MSDWKSVRELFFGYIDAKNYQDSADVLFFKNAFQVDEKIDELIKPRTFFLIGEKGTGKTAYATYISTFKSDYNCDIVSVEPTDYLDLVRIFKSDDFTVSDYSEVWQIALLILIFKNFTDSFLEEGDLSPSARATIKTIRTASLGSERLRFSDVFNILRDLDRFCEMISTAAVNKSKNDYDFAAAEVRLKLNFIRQAFLNILKELPAGSQYTIFIDGIDVRPDNVEYETFRSCTSGLVNGLWIVNAEYLDSLKERRFKAILLIRPDILDAAGLHNVNLKVHDNSVLLDWRCNYKFFDSSTLFKATNRLLSCQQNPDIKQGPGDAWHHYFQFKIYNRTATGENKYTDDPFINFLRHSFYKPRDVVQYLQIMRSRWVQIGYGDYTEFSHHVFGDKIIQKNYSDYLLGEIKNALRFYYRSDDFELLLKFFSLLENGVDKMHGSFSYESFLKSFSEFEKWVAQNPQDVPVLFENADALLQFLYELNVICFRMEKPGAKYPETKWCFRERSFTNIRPKVNSNCDYEFHTGVARAIYPDAR